MAGTLILDTIKSSTTSPPAFQNTNGTQIGTLCRAWVNFNGTGTVAIRASFNVTSITDNATGNYTLNFTTALPDVDYIATMGLVAPDVGNGVVVKSTNVTSAPDLKSTTQLQIIVSNATATYVDAAQIYAAIFR